MTRNQTRPPTVSARWRIAAGGALVASLLGGMIFAAGPDRAAAADFAADDEVVVDTQELNFRAGPGLDEDVLAILEDGTTAVVVEGPETADDYDWYRIAVEGEGEGWVIGEALLAADEAATDDATPQAQAPTFAANDAVLVATDALNLREDASLDADVLEELPYGTEATVLEGPVTADGYTWYRLDAGDVGEGWGAAEFLQSADDPLPPLPTDAFGAGDELTVDADGLNLRTEAGLDAEVIDVLAFGTSVTVLDGPVEVDDYTWYRLDTPAGEGWSAGEFLIGADADLAVGAEAVVADGPLALRDGAGLDADVLDFLDADTALTIEEGPVTADGLAWYRISIDGEVLGWVAGRYLSTAG